MISTSHFANLATSCTLLTNYLAYGREKEEDLIPYRITKALAAVGGTLESLARVSEACI